MAEPTVRDSAGQAVKFDVEAVHLPPAFGASG